MKIKHYTKPKGITVELPWQKGGKIRIPNQQAADMLIRQLEVLAYEQAFVTQK